MLRAGVRACAGAARLAQSHDLRLEYLVGFGLYHGLVSHGEIH